MSKTRFNELELTDDGDDSVTFYFKTGTMGVSEADADGDEGNIDFEEDVYYWKSRPDDNGIQDFSIARTFTITQYTPSGIINRQMTINPAQIVTSASGDGQTYYYTTFVPDGNRLYFPQGKEGMIYRGYNGLINTTSDFITPTASTDSVDSDYGFNIKELSSVVFIVNDNEITSNTTVKINDIVKLKLTANNSFKEPTTYQDSAMSAWCDSTTNMITFTVGGYTFAPSLSSNSSGTQWTGSFTVSSSYSSGALSFNVNFLDIYDNRADRITETTNGYGITLDTTVPTVNNVTSSTDDGLYTTDDVISIQVVFSESVYVTGTPQLSIDTGTDVNYSSGTGSNTLTFNYTVVAGDTSSDLAYASTNSLLLNSGTIMDAAGNDATLTLATPGASGSLNYNKNIVIDTAGPTMTISSTDISSGGTSNHSPLQLTFEASEATTDFVVSHITTSHGSLNSLTTTDNITFTTDLTPESTDHTCTISVDAGKFTDAAGNSNAVSNTFTWNYDGTAPTMTIYSTDISSGSTSNDLSIGLTFEVSEATEDFDIGDITVTNGTLSDFESISSLVYTATFTPSANGECTINVEAGSFTDTVGFQNLASDTFTWTYLRNAPEMTITSNTISNNSTSNDSSIILIFTSSITTNNFGVGDITVTNGSLRNFYSKSSSVYSAILTPTSNGICTIYVKAGAFTDIANLQNVESNTFTWSYDGLPPNVIITSSEINNGDSYNSYLNLTFTISESVNKFLEKYISVTNGNISNFKGSGTSYTATFTPKNQGVCTIYISKHLFKDLYNNLNSASTKFSWTYNNIPPNKPTVKFTSVNLPLNYNYTTGSSMFYYNSNARGTTNDYYNNQLSIEFSNDVYKWDYSTDGGITYNLTYGNTLGSIVLNNGTYTSGKIIIRNYDAAGNVSSVINGKQIIIQENDDGNIIQNSSEGMSRYMRRAQYIRLYSK